MGKLSEWSRHPERRAWHSLHCTFARWDGVPNSKSLERKVCKEMGRLSGRCRPRQQARRAADRPLGGAQLCGRTLELVGLGALAAMHLFPAVFWPDMLHCRELRALHSRGRRFSWIPRLTNSAFGPRNINKRTMVAAAWLREPGPPGRPTPTGTGRRGCAS